MFRLWVGMPRKISGLREGVWSVDGDLGVISGKQQDLDVLLGRGGEPRSEACEGPTVEPGWWTATSKEGSEKRLSTREGTVLSSSTSQRENIARLFHHFLNSEHFISSFFSTATAEEACSVSLKRDTLFYFIFILLFTFHGEAVKNKMKLKADKITQAVNDLNHKKKFFQGNHVLIGSGVYKS